jgi:hypothetical protein
MGQCTAVIVGCQSVCCAQVNNPLNHLCDLFWQPKWIDCKHVAAPEFQPTTELESSPKQGPDYFVGLSLGANLPRSFSSFAHANFSCAFVLPVLKMAAEKWDSLDSWPH